MSSYLLSTEQRGFIEKSTLQFERTRVIALENAEASLSGAVRANRRSIPSIRLDLDAVEKLEFAEDMLVLSKLNCDVLAQLTDDELIYSLRQNAAELMSTALDEESTTKKSALRWVFGYIHDMLRHGANLKVNPTLEERITELKRLTAPQKKSCK